MHPNLSGGGGARGSDGLLRAEGGEAGVTAELKVEEYGR